MAVTTNTSTTVVVALGAISFIFGVIAENKKPPSGIPIQGKDFVICQYTSDPTVILGYLSFGFLMASAVLGFLSTFYPYEGKSVPCSSLFKSSNLKIFFNIALSTSVLAAALILWPTMTEQHHLKYNVHHNMKTDCPTAKTGLTAGGAFMSLNASLLWLVSLMLTKNAREDYFDTLDENRKSSMSHA